MKSLGIDPASGKEVFIKSVNSPRGAAHQIVRKDPDEILHFFDTGAYAWNSVASMSFADEISAINFYKNYTSYCVRNADRIGTYTRNDSLPRTKCLILDTNKFLANYECPICKIKHVTRIYSEIPDRVRELIPRRCPVTYKQIEIQFRHFGSPNAWLCSGGTISEPETPMCPCPECKGTGEYIGFTSVSPCSNGCKKPS